MKDYIEKRAIEIAEYLIETKATVRAAAQKFGVSKSTVHTVVAKQNGLCGWWNSYNCKFAPEIWKSLRGFFADLY